MRKMFVFGKIETDNIGSDDMVINGRSEYVDITFAHAFRPYNHIEVTTEPKRGFQKVEFVEKDACDFYMFKVKTYKQIHEVAICVKRFKALMRDVNPEKTPIYLKLGRLSRSKVVKAYFDY